MAKKAVLDLDRGIDMKRVLVCGGRDYDNLGLVLSVLSERVTPDTVIIEGGASGADFLAKCVGKYLGATVETYPANWSKYGKAAGMIRNKQMLDEGRPDLVVAFPGGFGTKGMIRLAREAGVDVLDMGNQ